MRKQTQTQVVDNSAQIEAIMAKLRQPKTNRSLIDRITDAAVDSVADATDTLSRFGAAAMSAIDNAGDAYELERERQLRRRAEKILKSVQQ